MNRRNFIKRGALFVPAIFIPRLIRATPAMTAFFRAKVAASGGGGGVTWTLVAHATAGALTLNPATTPTRDITGANLVVLGVTCLPGGTMGVSDNKSNSYTALTSQQPSSQDRAQLFYKLSPTTDAAFTATAQGSGGGGYPRIFMLAVQKSGGTPTFDVENGTTFSGSSSTRTMPSLTPGGSNELCVGLMSTGSPYSGTPTAVTQGFAIPEAVAAAGIAWLAQTTATAG